MNNVIFPPLQPFAKRRFLKYRSARLLNRKQTQLAQRRAHPDNLDIGMIVVLSVSRRTAREHFVCGWAVKHRHAMTASRQTIGQSMGVNPVSAKVVWRIKRADDAESKRRFRHLRTDPRVSWMSPSVPDITQRLKAFDGLGILPTVAIW